MKRKKLVAIFLSAALMLSFVSLTAFAKVNEEIEDGTEETSIVEEEETEETAEAEVSEETLAEDADVAVEETDIATEETTEISEETEVTVEVGSNAEVEPVSTDVAVEETEVTEVAENVYDFESTDYDDTIACTEYLACDYDVRTEADPNADVLVRTEEEGLENRNLCCRNSRRHQLLHSRRSRARS